MDLGLTEIQQMLKNSAREFLSQECPLALVREMEEVQRGFTDELWRQIVSLGWTGLAFPEQYGGTGGEFIDLAVLLEEMGRSILPGPFFSTVVLGGLTVLDAGNEEQKRDILTRICDGQLLMTLALTEPSATYEPWGVEATATQHGDAYLLDGTKLFVPDAHAADLLLVAARTAGGPDPSDGISLFLVPSNCSGLGVSQLGTIASDRLCEVTLNQVSVPASSVMGAGWRGLADNSADFTTGRGRPVRGDARWSRCRAGDDC